MELPQEQTARFEAFSRPLTWLAAFFAGFYGLCGVVLDSGALVACGVLACALVAACHAGTRFARRGRMVPAALAIAFGLQGIAFSFAFLLPFVFPTLAMMPIAAVALTLPYLTGRPLQWVIAGAFVISVSATVVGILMPDTVPLPPVLRAFVLISTVAIDVGLTMILLWQFSTRLRQTALRDETALKERSELLAELRQAIRVREEFLSVASHELKTPLTPLNLKLQFLSRELHRQPDSRFVRNVRGYLETAQKQVRRLNDLIDGLLDVSRIQAGRLKLNAEPVDFSALVREVAARFDEQARRVGCLLRVQVPKSLVGRWDGPRLEQVVMNLLDNALKYGHDAPVEVALTTEGKSAVLTVTDHGIGVPADQTERIFERFERAVSDRHYGGLGLGLYISREIVTASGGSIHVVSDPGNRTTFTVELPHPLAELATASVVSH